MTLSENIIHAAFKLFMKYGVRSVSMDDLANVLGMSKKTIYCEFDSKQSLIDKVIKIHLKNDEEKIKEIINNSANALDEMIGISQHVIQFLMQIKPSLIFDLKKFYPQCWDLIEQQHFNFIKTTIEQNVIRGQKEGLYRDDVHPGIISRLYVAKSNTIVNQDIFPLTEFDLPDLFRQLEMYHLFGIVSEEGKKLLHQNLVNIK
ncbi:MAG: TetR/AcrR family transcriptional regulator [Saprospiraceae bacterium]|nr:TetR/AcrR family transcriptional regulator [Saprospiraceae bacterium]